MAYLGQREQESKEISDVNVVPLADVSLCLLIILMVISPMMAQNVLLLRTAAQSKDASAPPKPEPPPLVKQDVILVVGLGNDSLSVGDQTFYSLADFMAYVSAALKSRADKKVFLAPRPDVINGKVVNMIEILKNLGAESVALVQSVTGDAPTEPLR